jgi:serine/threonine protein kinase
MNTDGFEEEVLEIKNHLSDLDEKEKVSTLLFDLKNNIEDYRNESKLLKKEFENLPLDIIDKDKRDEIQSLLSSPKTIKQAKKWIRNIQTYTEKRDRICFPKELTQYTDEYLVGTGGFSRVYKVKNIKENRTVAVKIPINKDATIGKSFLRELNNWVSLKHKNIVKIFHYNILPVPYIEMEWCNSCLADIEKPVQFNLATYYIQGIAEGLYYAHKNNIAHFDLKPQNILLKNDVPKITDWGLSRLLTKHGTTTLGISLPFAAPEQFSIRYGKKDAKTDIWQLGILYYHLLTNSVPFAGKDFAEYGKNITSTNIKKLILEDESIEEVSHILVKCLAKRKKNRYKNLKGFLKDIKKIM